MAYIDKTAFEARITNNEFEENAQVAGKFKESNAYAVCSAGFLVKRNELLDCEGFSGIKNENAWEMVAAESTDTASEVIYACDTHDVNILTGVGGGEFKIGTNTLGLPAQAGRMCNYCRIDFDGESVYRFGEGNFDGTIGAKTVFSIDDGLLKPESAAPTANGAIYFELRGTGNFVEGASDSFKYYDLVAKKVLVAASGS